jgi:hypothetical protein
MLDLGIASVAAQTHDIAVKGSLGMTYKLPHHTQVGMFYHSELRQDFDDIIQTSPSLGGALTIANDGEFQSLNIEQPRTLGIGISNEMLMDGNLLLAADIMYKNWGNANFWKDIYKDQWIFSMGAQLTDGPWEWRAGYGYADDPTREKTGGLSQLPNVCTGLPDRCTIIPSSGVGDPGGADCHRTGTAGTKGSCETTPLMVNKSPCMPYRCATDSPQSKLKTTLLILKTHIGMISLEFSLANDV